MAWRLEDAHKYSLVEAFGSKVYNEYGNLASESQDSSGSFGRGLEPSSPVWHEPSPSSSAKVAIGDDSGHGRLVSAARL